MLGGETYNKEYFTALTDRHSTHGYASDLMEILQEQLVCRQRTFQYRGTKTWIYILSFIWLHIFKVMANKEISL